jgi:transposase
MLVELSVMEQRYHAVMEVISGAPVTEVARRYGVSRQAVHGWLGRYERDGLTGLADHSHRPAPTMRAARKPWWRRAWTSTRDAIVRARLGPVDQVVAGLVGES